MPGGRITLDDRQHIAQALREGRGYAEIARRLGRPTSTVSREVARNGGRDGYRPDRAQQDTRDRARRGVPALLPEPPGMVEAQRADPDKVRDFEQRFIEIAVHTGFPQMVAKVLVCLFTSDTDGITAGEMVQRLRVSPSSISKAIGMLEQVHFVVRRRVPGTRRERYVIDDDVWLRAFSRRAETFAMYAAVAAEGAAIYGADTAAGGRLDEMSRFFGLVYRDVAQVTEHWQRHFATRQTSRAPREAVRPEAGRR